MRIARCNSAIQAYDYTIKRIKVLENGLTRALSRDFKDYLISHKLNAAQARSQGPSRKNIRQFGKLDLLADDSSENC
ncbi:hypothetical protein AYI68_g7765 [Smittium mucronatum]|uniref:Uncharacterized protein n=1 Tax=Smittium mucronatum TaxID=133383 RepID=A0A1R0GMS7_9FUNG|nr:hypothetical protein AYI68_g7765 [Smittium mucronatum]